MRATTFSLLATLICLAGLEHSPVHAAQVARPQYYFPRVVKRQLDPKPWKPDAKIAAREPQLEGLLDITVGLDGVLEPETTPPTARPTVGPGPIQDGFFGPGTVSPSRPTPSPQPDNPGLDLTDILPPVLPTRPTTTPAPSQPSSNSNSNSPPPSSESEPTPPQSSRPPLVDLPDLIPDVLPPIIPPKPSTPPPQSPTEEVPSPKPETPDPPEEKPDPGLPELPLPSLPLPSLPLPSDPLPSDPLPSDPLPTEVVPTEVLPTDPLPTESLPTSNTIIPIPTSTPDGVFPSSDYWGTGSSAPTAPPPEPTPPSSSEPSSEPPSSVTESEPPAYTTEPPVISSEEPEPPETEAPPPPISTDTNTKMYVPTSIMLAPTDEPIPTQTSAGDTLPSDLPKEIVSPDAPTTPPPGSVLIQLGFKQQLHYGFVAKHNDASIQIFAYLPEGVSYALGVPVSDIRVNGLGPYNSDVLPYQATVATTYIPSDLVSKLEAALHNPSSLLWNHPSGPVKTIVNQLDPSIPIWPGTTNGSTGGPDDSSPGPDSGDGGDGPNGDGGAGSGNSSGVRVSAVGIGLGVVGAAALYGAAMFFVARRYRQRRRAHRRTSSLTSGLSPDSSRAASPSEALMNDAAYGRNSRNSGGAGSGRTQMISAPVMSENSLGWN